MRAGPRLRSAERTVHPSRSGRGGRYEIFHDVLAAAVPGLAASHETRRAVDRERAASTRRQRRLGSIAALALVGLGVSAGLAVRALAERHNAQEQTSAAQAAEQPPPSRRHRPGGAEAGAEAGRRDLAREAGRAPAGCSRAEGRAEAQSARADAERNAQARSGGGPGARPGPGGSAQRNRADAQAAAARSAEVVAGAAVARRRRRDARRRRRPSRLATRERRPSRLPCLRGAGAARGGARTSRYRPQRRPFRPRSRRAIFAPSAPRSSPCSAMGCFVPGRSTSCPRAVMMSSPRSPAPTRAERRASGPGPPTSPARDRHDDAARDRPRVRRVVGRAPTVDRTRAARRRARRSRARPPHARRRGPGRHACASCSLVAGIAAPVACLTSAP